MARPTGSIADGKIAGSGQSNLGDALMSIKLHYQFENTGATWAKVKIDKSTGSIRKKAGTGEVKYNSDVEGSCFGYSIDWARRMIQYKGDIEKSRPNKGIGTALQMQFEMKFNKQKGKKFDKNVLGVTFIVSNMSLTLVENYTCDVDDLAETVDSDAAIVIMDCGVHWMAMGKINAKRYYFDSNDGCYSASTLSDYKNLVELFRKDYKDEKGFVTDWDVYSIAPG